MTVLIAIALSVAITFVPKVSAEESAEDPSMLSEVSSSFMSMIEDIQFVLDAAFDVDFIEALLTVALSEEDVIYFFTAVAMVVELLAGMIIAAILSTFIAVIVVVLTLPFTFIFGILWDIFALLILLYGGIFIGYMATVWLDDATGLSVLIGRLLSRIYFELASLWQAMYRILVDFCFNPEEVSEEEVPAVLQDEI